MAKADLTAERLREILQYDPDTGVFTRLVSARGRGAHAGAIAGSGRPDGYIAIRVDGSRYYAHRLAWLYVHGMFPVNDIDHIDGNPNNNRIRNLRDVSRQGNLQNQRKARPSNKLGLLGVFENKQIKSRGKRYMAKIVSEGKLIHIGSFRTPDEAHAAYLDAKRRLHPTCTI